MLCCETLSQWVYHVYVFIPYSAPTHPENPASSSCGSWFGSSASELKVTAGMMSWAYAFHGKLIKRIKKKKQLKHNIMHVSSRFSFFNMFTCCLFRSMQEKRAFSFTHAEHYQVYKKTTKRKGAGEGNISLRVAVHKSVTSLNLGRKDTLLF